MFESRSVRWTTCLLVSVATGCSGEGRRPVFPVEGRLTYQGRPMSGAMISLHPRPDPGPSALRSQATADMDGFYRMTTYLKHDGVPTGEYAVTIYWPGKKPARSKAAPNPEDDGAAAPDQLKDAFTDRGRTRLRATVGGKENRIDFSLP